MTFLPIVTRELRVAARRRGTYWLRSGAALALVIAGTWLFLMMQNQPPPTVATALFSILTGGAVLYALLCGVRLTADCLSEEKRAGTLGLLFLTDLRGYDVVLGKLAATSLSALYGLLAVVPMLAIPLLIGGITPGEFGRMALVALNTLFWSLALGLCSSAMCRSAQKSAAATFLVLLLLTALLPALGAILAAYHRTARVEPLFLLTSPGFTYYLAFAAQYQAQRLDFWRSAVALHALGWLALALASVIAPRTWQDKPASAQTLRWRERWRLWGYGNLAERLNFRRRLLGSNAFFWLSARARLRPASVWLCLGLIACAWFWGLAKFRGDWLNESLYVTTALCLNFILRWWFAAEATRQLAEERRAGTLELLLSTPLSVRDILRGQRLALQRQFLGPVLTVLAVECWFMFATLREAGLAEDRAFWTALWMGGMIMLVADLAALYWIGMWQALTAKRPARASSISLSLVWFVPWLGMALALLFLALSATVNPSGLSPSWQLILGLWFGLGIGADVVFAGNARSKLLAGFRLAAQQRYTPSPTFWQRVFGAGSARGHRAPAAGALPGA